MILKYIKDQGNSKIDKVQYIIGNKIKWNIVVGMTAIEHNPTTITYKLDSFRDWQVLTPPTSDIPWLVSRPL